jgi:circadian clock protein KaiB
MTTEKRPRKTRKAIRATAATPQENCLGQKIFHLFVAGQSPRSERARLNLAAALADWNAPAGSYDVEIIDVFKAPMRAVSQGIMATPALFVDFGRHRSVLVGDLSDSELLMSFLTEAAKEHVG